MSRSEIERILDEASETGMLPWPAIEEAKKKARRQGRSLGPNPPSMQFIGNATDDLVEEAAKMPGVRCVYINGVRGTRLDALHRLTRVEHLVLTNATKLTSLASISGMKGLRTLWIEHLPRLNGLDALRPLKGLRGLYYSGLISSDYDARPASLKPLSALTELRVLKLNGVNPRDGLLTPLLKLKKLREVWLANSYRLEQFAALTAAFPELGPEPIYLWPGFTSMWWEKPVPLGEPHGYNLCQRCEEFTKGSTKGKPIKRLCPKCDAGRVAKFQAAWDEARAAASRRSSA